MPEITDYTMYFNLIFGVMIGLGALGGFIRGFKNSLYAFIVRVIFFAIFFLTINMVVNQLWTLEVAQLGQAFGMIDASLSNVTSLQQGLPGLLEIYLGDSLDGTLSNPEFLAFATGLGLFIVKLVYTLLYFTVFSVVYRLITWIIYMTIVKSSKDKERSKNRLIGASVGALSGALSVFVALIMLGGVMSISESMLAMSEPLLSEPNETLSTSEYYALSTVPLNDPLNPAPGDLEDAVAMLEDLTESYHNNIFVNMAYRIKITDNQAYEAPLNLYLFDSVFSFNYREQQISIRKELSITAQVVAIVLESDYMSSENISDIKGSDIRSAFEKLSESDLFVSLLPLAIEVGADYSDLELDIAREQLYAIDWAHEVGQIGAVAALVFDIVNTAGLLDDEPNLETVTIAGNDVREVFDELADSDLAKLGAFVAARPLLAQAGGQIEAVITLPADLEWEAEFKAMGSIIGAILDTNVTVGELEGGDPTVLLNALSTLDFTVLLDSKIITHAMINVLEGRADIEALDQLMVPDDVSWFDTYDEDLIADKGELRLILEAVNTVTKIASSVDFDDLDFTLLDDLDDDDIDALLASYVLGTTLGNFVYELARDEDLIKIPPSALTSVMVKEIERTVVTNIEIKDMLIAVRAIGLGDTNDLNFGMDILKKLALDEDSTVLDEAKADEIFASKILHATLSSVILDFGSGENDFLVIPVRDMDDDVVRYFEDSLEYIHRDELKAVLRAVLVLDLQDFENVDTLDVGNVLTNIDLILDSSVFHLTISDQLLGIENFVIVPYLDSSENEIILTVVVSDLDYPDVTEYTYVTKTEIEAAVGALDALDISIDNFDTLENLSVEDIHTHIDTLLSSAILHATISKQIADIETFVVVPDRTVTEDDLVIIIAGQNIDDDDLVYILADEIKAVVAGLHALEIDINNLSTLETLNVTSINLHIDTLLESSILQASISKQILDIDSYITVPDYDYNEDDVVVRVEQFDTTEPLIQYITASEIKAVVGALDVLEIDINNSSSVENLSVELIHLNIDTILESVIFQASISKQLIGIESYVVVPDFAFDSSVIVKRVDQEDNTLDPTEFVLATEIKATIAALHTLNVDINDFSTVENLNIADINANKDILLASVIFHATISKQIDAIETYVVVPDFDVNEDEIVRFIARYDALLDDTVYILADEIKATLEALDILGVDINDFSSVETLSITEINTHIDTILQSVIFHATVSNQFRKIDTYIVIPQRASDNIIDLEVEVNQLDPLEDAIIYIIEDEIKASIAALDALGIDINNFAAIETITIDVLNQHITTLLSSHIVHASMSKQLMDLPDSQLIIPDNHWNLASPIRIEIIDGFIYVEALEIEYILAGIEEIGITTVNTIQITPQEILRNGPDIPFVLRSVSFHATISDTLIRNAYDEVERPTRDLIIPIYFRELIDVDSVALEQIEYTELVDLLAGLKVIDVDQFDGDLNEDVITALTQPELETMLESGSIHVTIDAMMRKNPNVDDKIPPLALDDMLYQDDVVIKTEIVAFMLATQQFLDEPGTNFTNVSFSANAISNKTPQQQDIIISSMIVRNVVTEELEPVIDAHPLYDINDAEYENGGSPFTPGDFFTKVQLQTYIDDLDTIMP